jgi:outer membrane protein assembly factor BamA
MGLRDGRKHFGCHRLLLNSCAAKPDATFDTDDSLGGDLAFATGMSVFAPVPGQPQWPLKLHGFINTGRVTAWDCGECSLHMKHVGIESE